ncbi:uncharacterized protein Dsimw501_GD28600 [Drosophila simulans]|uniref:Ataxin-2 C-terminal domain-containing protein n=1 Tax=Drosophila simulans TaxID=7240 RepID=A0A0J9QW20_DROSI|nr:uncharacterized protein Dsimw501_GD28600 [Drosophila simulans]
MESTVTDVGSTTTQVSNVDLQKDNIPAIYHFDIPKFDILSLSKAESRQRTLQAYELQEAPVQDKSESITSATKTENAKYSSETYILEDPQKPEPVPEPQNEESVTEEFVKPIIKAPLEEESFTTETTTTITTESASKTSIPETLNEVTVVEEVVEDKPIVEQELVPEPLKEETPVEEVVEDKPIVEVSVNDESKTITTVTTTTATTVTTENIIEVPISEEPKKVVEPEKKPEEPKKPAYAGLPVDDSSSSWMDVLDEPMNFSDDEEEPVPEALKEETPVEEVVEDKPIVEVSVNDESKTITTVTTTTVTTENIIEVPISEEPKKKTEEPKKPAYAGLPVDDSSSSWMDVLDEPMNFSDDEEEPVPEPLKEETPVEEVVEDKPIVEASVVDESKTITTVTTTTVTTENIIEVPISEEPKKVVEPEKKPEEPKKPAYAGLPVDDSSSSWMDVLDEPMNFSDDEEEPVPEPLKEETPVEEVVEDKPIVEASVVDESKTITTVTTTTTTTENIIEVPISEEPKKVVEPEKKTEEPKKPAYAGLPVDDSSNSWMDVLDEPMNFSDDEEEPVPEPLKEETLVKEVVEDKPNVEASVVDESKTITTVTTTSTTTETTNILEEKDSLPAPAEQQIIRNVADEVSQLEKPLEGPIDTWSSVLEDTISNTGNIGFTSTLSADAPEFTPSYLRHTFSDQTHTFLANERIYNEFIPRNRSEQTIVPHQKPKKTKPSKRQNKKVEVQEKIIDVQPAQEVCIVEPVQIVEEVENVWNKNRDGKSYADVLLNSGITDDVPSTKLQKEDPHKTAIVNTKAQERKKKSKPEKRQAEKVIELSSASTESEKSKPNSDSEQSKPTTESELSKPTTESSKEPSSDERDVSSTSELTWSALVRRPGEWSDATVIKKQTSHTAVTTKETPRQKEKEEPKKTPKAKKTKKSKKPVVEPVSTTSEDEQPDTVPEAVPKAVPETMPEPVEAMPAPVEAKPEPEVVQKQESSNAFSWASLVKRPGEWIDNTVTHIKTAVIPLPDVKEPTKKDNKKPQKPKKQKATKKPTPVAVPEDEVSSEPSEEIVVEFKVEEKETKSIKNTENSFSWASLVKKPGEWVDDIASRKKPVEIIQEEPKEVHPRKERKISKPKPKPQSENTTKRNDKKETREPIIVPSTSEDSDVVEAVEPTDENTITWAKIASQIDHMTDLKPKAKQETKPKQGERIKEQIRSDRIEKHPKDHAISTDLSQQKNEAGHSWSSVVSHQVTDFIEAESIKPVPKKSSQPKIAPKLEEPLQEPVQNDAESTPLMPWSEMIDDAADDVVVERKSWKELIEDEIEIPLPHENGDEANINKIIETIQEVQSTSEEKPNNESKTITTVTTTTVSEPLKEETLVPHSWMDVLDEPMNFSDDEEEPVSEPLKEETLVKEVVEDKPIVEASVVDESKTITTVTTTTTTTETIIELPISEEPKKKPEEPKKPAYAGLPVDDSSSSWMDVLDEPMNFSDDEEEPVSEPLKEETLVKEVVEDKPIVEASVVDESKTITTVTTTTTTTENIIEVPISEEPKKVVEPEKKPEEPKNPAYAGLPVDDSSSSWMDVLDEPMNFSDDEEEPVSEVLKEETLLKEVVADKHIVEASVVDESKTITTVTTTTTTTTKTISELPIPEEPKKVVEPVKSPEEYKEVKPKPLSSNIWEQHSSYADVLRHTVDFISLEKNNVEVPTESNLGKVQTVKQPAELPEPLIKSKAKKEKPLKKEKEAKILTPKEEIIPIESESAKDETKTSWSTMVDNDFDENVQTNTLSSDSTLWSSIVRQGVQEPITKITQSADHDVKVVEPAFQNSQEINKFISHERSSEVVEKTKKQKSKKEKKHNKMESVVEVGLEPYVDSTIMRDDPKTQQDAQIPSVVETLPIQPMSWSSIVSQNMDVTTNVSETRNTAKPEDKKSLEDKPTKQKTKKEKKSKAVRVSEPIVKSAVPEAVVEPTVEVTFVEEPVVEVTTVVEEVSPEPQPEPTLASEVSPSQPLSWSSIVSQTTEVTTNVTETRFTEEPEEQKSLEEKPKKQKAKKEKKSKVILDPEPIVESAVPVAVVEPTVKETFVEEPVVEVTTVVEEVSPEPQPEPTPVSEVAPSQPLSWSSIVSQTTEDVAEAPITDVAEDQKPLIEKPKKLKARKEKKSKVQSVEESIVVSDVPVSVVEPIIGFTTVQKDVAPITESHTFSWSSIVAQSVEVPPTLPQHVESKSVEIQNFIDHEQNHSTVVNDSVKKLKPKKEKKIVQPIQQPTGESVPVRKDHMPEGVTKAVPEPQTLSWSSIVSHNIDLTPTFTENRVIETVDEINPDDSSNQEGEHSTHVDEKKQKPKNDKKRDHNIESSVVNEEIPETERVAVSLAPEFNIQLPAPTKPSVWSSSDTYAEVVKKSGYNNNTNIKYQKIEAREPIKSEPKHTFVQVQTHEDLLEFPDPIIPAIEGDEALEKPSQLSWKDLVDEDDVEPLESWHKEETDAVEIKTQKPIQERHSRVSVKPKIQITEVVTETQPQSETDQEFLQITSKKRNRSRSRSQQSQASNFDEKPQSKKSKKPKNNVPKAPAQQPTEAPEDVQPPKEAVLFVEEPSPPPAPSPYTSGMSWAAIAAHNVPEPVQHIRPLQVESKQTVVEDARKSTNEHTVNIPITFETTEPKTKKPKPKSKRKLPSDVVDFINAEKSVHQVIASKPEIVAEPASKIGEDVNISLTSMEIKTPLAPFEFVVESEVEPVSEPHMEELLVEKVLKTEPIVESKAVDESKTITTVTTTTTTTETTRDVSIPEEPKKVVEPEKKPEEPKKPAYAGLPVDDSSNSWMDVLDEPMNFSDDEEEPVSEPLKEETPVEEVVEDKPIVEASVVDESKTITTVTTTTTTTETISELPIPEEPKVEQTVIKVDEPKKPAYAGLPVDASSNSWMDVLDEPMNFSDSEEEPVPESQTEVTPLAPFKDVAKNITQIVDAVDEVQKPVETVNISIDSEYTQAENTPLAPFKEIPDSPSDDAFICETSYWSATLKPGQKPAATVETTETKPEESQPIKVNIPDDEGIDEVAVKSPTDQPTTWSAIVQTETTVFPTPDDNEKTPDWSTHVVSKTTDFQEPKPLQNSENITTTTTTYVTTTVTTHKDTPIVENESPTSYVSTVVTSHKNELDLEPETFELTKPDNLIENLYRESFKVHPQYEFLQGQYQQLKLVNITKEPCLEEPKEDVPLVEDYVIIEPEAIPEINSEILALNLHLDQTYLLPKSRIDVDTISQLLTLEKSSDPIVEKEPVPVETKSVEILVEKSIVESPIEPIADEPLVIETPQSQAEPSELLWNLSQDDFLKLINHYRQTTSDAFALLPSTTTDTTKAQETQDDKQKTDGITETVVTTTTTTITDRVVEKTEPDASSLPIIPTAQPLTALSLGSLDQLRLNLYLDDWQPASVDAHLADDLFDGLKRADVVSSEAELDKDKNQEQQPDGDSKKPDGVTGIPDKDEHDSDDDDDDDDDEEGGKPTVPEIRKPNDDDDKPNDKDPGSGSSGNVTPTPEHDAQYGQNRSCSSEYRSTDLPGGVGHWRDDSTYLALEAEQPQVKLESVPLAPTISGVESVLTETNITSPAPAHDPVSAPETSPSTTTSSLNVANALIQLASATTHTLSAKANAAATATHAAALAATSALLPVATAVKPSVVTPAEIAPAATHTETTSTSSSGGEEVALPTENTGAVRRTTTTTTTVTTTTTIETPSTTSNTTTTTTTTSSNELPEQRQKVNITLSLRLFIILIFAAFLCGFGICSWLLYGNRSCCCCGQVPTNGCCCGNTLQQAAAAADPGNCPP